MIDNIFERLESLGQVRLALRDALVPKYGEGEAAAMARSALMTLKDWDLPHLMANEDRPASDFIKARCAEILHDLLNDMPLQYALGSTNFYGLTLKVGPGVLIPRPETAELVDLIVKENEKDDLRVLDLCTGSGAIALALARNLPFSRVTALDISPEAIATTKENADSLKVKLNIIQEDVFTHAFPSRSFDIIVSNPPYVDESEKADMEANVLNYEPHIALFVPDNDPLRFYKRIAEIAQNSLAEGGKLYFEINPRHAVELASMLKGLGYLDVEILKDSHGKERFAKAQI